MDTGLIEVDEGVRLFYRAAGFGSDLVLLPNGLHLVDDFQPLATRFRLIFYDVRNRGLSTTVSDASKLVGGIHQDVSDLDAVRRYFDANQVDVIGHSYVGVTAMLYAMKFPGSVRRVVAIGTMGPQPSRTYAPPLAHADETLQRVLSQLAELEPERSELPREEFCRKFWSVLRLLYVTDAADADKIRWSRCELPNELNFMQYWIGHLLPSLNALALTDDDLKRVTAPVLLVHGTKDRSAPYGGGREWALRLPNARLLAVTDAGHAPWIENPSLTLGALRSFLEDGGWPPASEHVRDAGVLP
jgi:pimeloyl-ACP methyl ester carboxylesterase